MSLGLILGHASAILPFSSIRNAERMMPMYFLPYIDFSPQAPYLSATLCSGSDSSGKPSEYFSSNFFCLAGASGLMPRIWTSTSSLIAQSSHDWVVQPGVSAFG